MNTAPQDDFSGDLARNLGGWSDDALLKELSRRTTMTTDADHELISTGAGIHLQHRRAGEPNPLSVTWDAETEKWTISVTGLRWTSAQNPTHPEDKSITQGVYGDKTWTFSDHLSVKSPQATVYIGWQYPDTVLDPIAKWDKFYTYQAGYGLRFAIHYHAPDPDDIVDIEDSAADKVVYDGTFHQIATVDLYLGGNIVILSDVRTPHVTHTPYVPGDRTHLFWEKSTGTLYLRNIALGNADTAPYQSGLGEYSLVIPADTEDIVQLGAVQDAGTRMKLRDDGTVDWDEPYPLQLCEIKTDDTGELVHLKPFTERLHYRPSDSPRVAMGTISSKINDNKYRVKMYENGLWDDDETAAAYTGFEDCYIYQIRVDEEIPTGTVVMLFRFFDHWEFQVPVWL